MVQKLILVAVVLYLSMANARVYKVLPKPVEELQALYDKGKSHVYYMHLDSADDLESQTKCMLKRYLEKEYPSFDEDFREQFVKNTKLESDTKLENQEDVETLRKQLYNPEEFEVELVMGEMLENRDDAKEAQAAFNNVFLDLDDNTVVQLYSTNDGGALQGVIVAAMRKNKHAVLLVFITD